MEVSKEKLSELAEDFKKLRVSLYFSNLYVFQYRKARTKAIYDKLY